VDGAYRWPILFFVAVSFWNLVGAGLFGFLINPPMALYYMQGLNLTPLHGHTALFGVYGMLGIGLMLFCLRRRRCGTARCCHAASGHSTSAWSHGPAVPAADGRAGRRSHYWYARSAEHAGRDHRDPDGCACCDLLGRRAVRGLLHSLLTAAFMLMTMLHMYPISHDWLTLKVLLLVVYVVLGVQALRRSRTQAARLGWFAAALATYLVMFGIARAHHPLGWLRWWGWA
jgi:hypothetical protein